MSPSLLDINLQQVPDPYLSGTWRVVDRVLSHEDPTTALACATHLHLGSGTLRLDTATSETTGHWRVERDALLSRPYLLLELAQEEVSALVTRLRHSADGQFRALVLYFQSGLELFLVQP
jgi:hypothetical protein